MPRRRSTDVPEAPPGSGAPLKTSQGMIHVRLDDQTEAALQAYMAAMNMNRSQAARTLIYTGALAGAGDPDVALRAAAFREGMILGLRDIKKRIEDAVKAAMASMGEIIG